MKLIVAVSTTVLSLTLGAAAPIYAQQEQQNQQEEQKAKPAQDEKKAQPDKPAKQEEKSAQQQDKNTRPEEKNAQQQQHAQQRSNDHPQRTQEQQRVQQSAWQEHRSQRWDSDHRNWQQRGGYNGYRIPDNRYHGYFGRNHGFRIYGLPFLVVGGYPRFQYQGYWISLVDPWPEYWGNDWYDNDDVYIDYIDGEYFLFDLMHPGVRIALVVMM